MTPDILGPPIFFDIPMIHDITLNTDGGCHRVPMVKIGELGVQIVENGNAKSLYN